MLFGIKEIFTDAAGSYVEFFFWFFTKSLGIDLYDINLGELMQRAWIHQ